MGFELLVNIIGALVDSIIPTFDLLKVHVCWVSHLAQLLFNGICSVLKFDVEIILRLHELFDLSMVDFSLRIPVE